MLNKTRFVSWRRFAFPATLVLGGVGLAAGVGFKLRQQNRTDAFNSSVDPTCAEQKVGYGGPSCAALRDQGESARLWSNVGLGVAAASALAAVVLKLTEPAESHVAFEARPQRLACAPGFGLSASCALTF
jgi:hypothetical protein